LACESDGGASIPDSTVLIVCGLKREAAVFAGPGALSAYGDGPTLRSKLDELADRPLRMVVSFGMCGGLDPTLRCGDVVLGTEVVSGRESVTPDAALTQALKRRLVEGGERPILGRIAAVDAPVLTREEKSALRNATGAAAVDMESLAAGHFARARGVPFAILRAVSDSANRDLPPLALAAVDPTGGVNIGAVIRELIRSRSQLRGLIAAAVDSAAAIRALRRCSRLGGPFPDLLLPHL
jgi:adenosylhomocysteine nucleosidase